MENPHEAIPPEASVERLKVIEATRGKNPVSRLAGHYHFDTLKTEEGVSCKWRLQPEPVGLSVHGQVRGVLVLECARCLEPYTLPLELVVDERYVFQASLEQPDKERELHADDFYETLDEDGELDLKDLAYQVLLLELENHPNCERPECRFA